MAEMGRGSLKSGVGHGLWVSQVHCGSLKFGGVGWVLNWCGLWWVMVGCGGSRVEDRDGSVCRPRSVCRPPRWRRGD